MKRIAVIGCGLGGAATTLMLQKMGFQVTIYEQAPTFKKLGAGIHLTPNVIKALAWTEIVPSLIEMAYKPTSFVSRDAFTDEIIAELPLGRMVTDKFGAPYLTVNRGDFHALMVDALKLGTLQFNKHLQSVDEENYGVRLSFEDGSEDIADIVIGADGLSSVVRGAVCKNSPPHFSGQAAFRALVDVNKLGDYCHSLSDITKWWSEDRFVIAYYMNSCCNQYYFVAGVPQDTWPSGIQSLPSCQEEVMEHFSDFHPAAKKILASSEEVSKWPLYERPAEVAWSNGRIVMLGDACHPMRPHMAQGAAMAIEDGAVLVRCLIAAGLDNWSTAYELYQQTRYERVEKVQRISSENSWMRTTPDPAWLFSSDAWNVPLSGQPDL